jgi:hypothetical protein
MPQLLLAFVLALGKSTLKKDVVSCAPPAKCYGYSPCNACSDCSACAYCVDGRICGVCGKGKNNDKTSAKQSLFEAPVSSGQCKAITKKGSQCSRKGTDGGYCWQHKK